MRRISTAYWARLSMVIVSFALAAACTRLAPTAPQRTYEGVAPAELYAALEKVLVEAGYAIAIRDTNRGLIQTAWRETNVTGAAAARERRMYIASFDTESLHVRSSLFITLAVESRSPTNSSWTARPTARDNDPEYQQILQSLDRAVQDRGRQGTNVRGGSGR
jgi:uncharacterized lipoprotein